MAAAAGMLPALRENSLAADDCAICLESLAEDAHGPAVFLSGCGLNAAGRHPHGFHLSCIVRWRTAAGRGGSRSPSPTIVCPVCRKHAPGPGKGWAYEDRRGAPHRAAQQYEDEEGSGAPHRAARTWPSTSDALQWALDGVSTAIGVVLPLAVLVILARRPSGTLPRRRAAESAVDALQSLLLRLQPAATGAALEEAQLRALLGAAL